MTVAICMQVQPRSSCVSSTQKADPQTFEGFSSALNVKTGALLDNLEFRQTPHFYSTMIVSENYRKEIHGRLREALVWMKKKGFSHPKLEGRQVNIQAEYFSKHLLACVNYSCTLERETVMHACMRVKAFKNYLSFQCS